jgi:hypothetical protein
MLPQCVLHLPFKERPISARIPFALAQKKGADAMHRLLVKF